MKCTRRQGVYTFSTTSDDASDIWLNRSRIVDSDGLHDPIECSRSVALSAGVYPITINYLQRGGEAVLSVSMEGPGMAKRVVTGEDFCHEE